MATLGDAQQPGMQHAITVAGKSLAVPLTVDLGVMNMLGAELERVLACCDPRTASAIPTDYLEAGAGLVNDGGILSWTYNHVGDYDQNGEVNIADLSVIGLHLTKTTGVPDWATACCADGDRNGEVNIGDVSPIGAGYGGVLVDYVVEATDDGTAWYELDRVPLTAGVAPGGGGLLTFSYDASTSAAVGFRVQGVGEGGAPPDPTGDLTNIFFLHHSTGEGIVAGGMRGVINSYNASNETSYELWDQGYNWQDLLGPDGTRVSDPYPIPNDDTDPYGLWYLWTSSEADAVACRAEILGNHEVIAFKSCFPASAIPNNDELQWRKDIYLNMRGFFDTRPDKLFVVMSTPPLHPEDEGGEYGANARLFANWLKSSEYLAGHPNVVCFDLFDALAGPGDNLAAEYRQEFVDSHPNDLGYQAVAPLFANFLCDAAGAYVPPE